jgi:hypothetical protein
MYNVRSEKKNTKRNSVLLLHLVLFFLEQTLHPRPPFDGFNSQITFVPTY